MRTADSLIAGVMRQFEFSYSNGDHEALSRLRDQISDMFHLPTIMVIGTPWDIDHMESYLVEATGSIHWTAVGVRNSEPNVHHAVDKAREALDKARRYGMQVEVYELRVEPWGST